MQTVQSVQLLQGSAFLALIFNLTQAVNSYWHVLIILKPHKNTVNIIIKDILIA